jgi:threonine dehydrogenase-like Zn-dependent dehydrogenase
MRPPPASGLRAVLGHEFLGDVVEVGAAVRRHKVGDRVVVASFIGRGRCWYCAHDLWSLCDNSNTNPGIASMAYSYESGGIFGYSHADGLDGCGSGRCAAR